MTSVLLGLLLHMASSSTQDAKWAWRISDFNCPLVDDRPYIPIGVRIEGSAEAIERAKTAGLKDVLVELPADGSGWDRALASLKAADLRFLIAINSAGPNAQGYAIEPEGYRITGIKTDQSLDLSMPSATSAMLILALQRDASVQWSKKVPVVGGRLKQEIKVESELEHVLLMYPEVRELRMPDYWEALDAHRDVLLASLKNHKLGPNFRGIVNPMGTLMQFPGSDIQFVPSSPLFRLEMETFLRQKYTSVLTAARAWAIQAPDLSSFAEMARLVPLWSSNRGISAFWDTDSERQLNCDSRSSTAWQDIRSAISAAANRRYQKLVSAIRQVVDVPVIQEWNGWAGPYESAALGLNGIGVRLVGNNATTMLDSGSRAASAALRWTTPCWLLASDVRFTATDDIENTLADVLHESAAFGARGWFVRPTNDALWAAVAKLSSQPGLDPLIADTKPSAIFYPESAHNPAFPVSLSSRRWWLPSPASGSRVDLGDLYGAYRYKEGEGTTLAIWSQGEPRRAKLRSANPKLLEILTYDGFDPKAKIGKNSIELTIPRTPILIRGSDEIPIPEDALQETVSQFDQIFKAYEKKLPNITEARYYYNESVSGFERNPAASYLALRQLLVQLGKQVSTTLWIEAELTKNTNFSGPMVSPGTSGGSVMALRTRVASPPEGYYASYTANPRVDGAYEIWIAVGASEADRANLMVRIGDQALKLVGEPISTYGIGFGWIKLGEVSLVKGPIDVKVLLNSETGGEAGVDAIVLSPKPFRPSGVRQPDAMEFTKPGG